MKGITKSSILKMMEQELGKTMAEEQEGTITKNKIKKMMEEELAKLQELGPETGHVKGTDPAGVVRQVADDLSEMSDIMRDAPSTTTASEFAGVIQALSQELVQAADELKIDGPRPAHEGLSEARKRPLKRDRDAFDRNTRICLLYTSPSPRDRTRSRMPSSA